jgi:hypothetical protein
VASAAALVSSVADWLGIERFAAMGHSGGGPHALACGALLAERVLGVVVTAGLAPFGAEGLDFFAGMAASGVAELRAAVAGRAALEKHLPGSDDEPHFTPEDEAALAGEWSWFIDVVRAPLAGGMGGSSTTISPASARGVSTLPTSSLRPFSCTAGGIVPSSHGEWLAPLPLGRTATVPGGRSHLGTSLRCGSHGVAPKAPRSGLSPACRRAIPDQRQPPARRQ